MLVLGIAAIVEPLVATIAVSRVFSWIFLIAGVIRIVYAVQSRSDRGFWLKLAIGILYVITGIILLSNVFGAALTLTIAFGATILGQGILEVIAAFKSRPDPNWGLMLVSGLLAIVLGILIFINGVQCSLVAGSICRNQFDVHGNLDDCDSLENSAQLSSRDVRRYCLN